MEIFEVFVGEGILMKYPGDLLGNLMEPCGSIAAKKGVPRMQATRIYVKRNFRDRQWCWKHRVSLGIS
jgi:hypothetical protein